MRAIINITGVVVYSMILACGMNGNEKLAVDLLEQAKVKGGFIVHLGCGDGQLTTALRLNDKYIVQGLERDSENVYNARKMIQGKNLYGEITVNRLIENKLPYIDNLVNCLIVEKAYKVPDSEIRRVLCPNGVAMIKQQDRWIKSVKPRSTAIDEWTHFLHGADNNAVSHDSVVAPPRHVQWIGEPKWARSHEHMSSFSAAVSSGGRLFSIIDQGPRAAVVLQPEWFLIARDAFNGVVLWKRPISHWEWHLRGFRSGPTDLPRRLVAIDDHVYVPLGDHAVVHQLDAATGKTLTTFPKTFGTREIIFHNNILFVVASQSKPEPPDHKKDKTRVHPQQPPYLDNPPLKRLLAIDPTTGTVLWEKRDDSVKELMPTTLAAASGRVFFQNPDQVICMDAQTGQENWTTARQTTRSRYTWSAPTLVVQEGVVLSADRAVDEDYKLKASRTNEKQTVEWIASSAWCKAPIGELVAFSVENGEFLWSCPAREGFNSPVDVFVINGLVWTGNLTDGPDPGITKIRDIKTGQVKKTRPPDHEFFKTGGHHRCYRNKATEKYLLLGRMGLEFVDTRTGDASQDFWLRGTCQYGILPCNGLLYIPPHPCACFMESKLNGFYCLAPSRPGAFTVSSRISRLERGPAFNRIGDSLIAKDRDSNWPTYRHDMMRSGYTAVSVPTTLKQNWQKKLGGRLSSVTVADDKVFVARVDAGILVALDRHSGQTRWTFTADGRIDSPPTIWQGRVFFGGTDGYVYCLSADSGELAWRFLAAPVKQSIISQERPESVWPVHGSVLIEDGQVYFAAGRSSFLDDGMVLYRLDGNTGAVVEKTVLNDLNYNSTDVNQANAPGRLPDILSSDGQSIFMRHSRFDMNCQPRTPDVPHLFSAAGFLDGSWWHRTYWLYGDNNWSGYGGWYRAYIRTPTGRIMVFDDQNIYGFGRNRLSRTGAHPGIDGKNLFYYNSPADPHNPDYRFAHYKLYSMQRTFTPPDSLSQLKWYQSIPSRNTFWNQNIPIWAFGLVMTDETLFMAGPPDIMKTEDPADALQGKLGGRLLAVSTPEGEILADYPIQSIPTWDGMAAAYGCLFYSTLDGKVVCMAE